MTNYYSNGRYLAFSAGSAPTGSVHPKAAETLVNHGIKPNASRSKSWNEFKFPQIIFILDRLVWFGAEIAPFCWNKLILWRQL
ncbi:hypothetical protein [Legionella sp. PC1000]|uniref:hypothetical protein n=1 Tax=Legionella sp. PC1000 TaxID=2746060 RepID=UPI00351B9614